MKTAFIFPGQGSQKVGMGKALAEAYAEAREVFEMVDEALSQKLSALMFAGDEAELTLTENTQPALMAVSLAVTKVLEKQGGFTLADKGELFAGHSLGEYSALAAGGAFSISDAAKLLKIRGQAMQAAVPVGQGAMAAVLGLELADVEAIVDEVAKGEVIETANDNSPGQVVVSGTTGAIDRFATIATERGAKRCIKLPVSAPFHSSLMQPAADAMAKALDDVQIQAPSLPIIANVTAREVADPAEIKKLLVQQVTGRVRWCESTEFMVENGIQRFVELGSGKVLSGLVKRIHREAETLNAETPEDIDALLKVLTV